MMVTTCHGCEDVGWVRRDHKYRACMILKDEDGRQGRPIYHSHHRPLWCPKPLYTSEGVRHGRVLPV